MACQTAPVHSNGYDQLEGKWLAYYNVASRFTDRVKPQDKEDILHTIIMTLADVERNNGHKPFIEAVMYRIASRTVADYWFSHYSYNSGLDKLDEYYQFPGKPNEGGGFSMGDMRFTISVNSDNLSKTVTAFGYLTPDDGKTYPDMPSPLGAIYGRLRVLAMVTEEVYCDNIKD